MGEYDLGWLVGILEGEGAFVVCIDKRRPTTSTVKIQVEMTDLDMIERIQSLVPGRVWKSDYPSRKIRFPNCKDSWRWAISRKDQVKVLTNLIYPYMSERRKQQLDALRPHYEYIKKHKE